MTMALHAKGFGRQRSRWASAAFVLLITLATRALAGGVTLAWDPVTSPALVGYMLYSGPSARGYTTKIDVGNATSRTVQNLTEGATYHFAVTAYDASHTESPFSNDVAATIAFAAPIAGFTTSSTSGAAPLGVNFTSTSTGSISGYAWTFGDGTSSTATNPSHVYSTPGVFTVTLVVTGAGGSSTKSMSNLVTVRASTTTTTLSASPNPAYLGIVVTLTATVSGNGPTGTVQFTDGGGLITTCAAVPLVGSGSVRTATCATSLLLAGTHSILAKYSGDAVNAASTSNAISERANVAPGGSIDVALAVNGGVASASSTLRAINAVDYVNNGQRSGAGWSTGGGGWADATKGVFPDWVQIAFDGQKTIDHVVVYSVQDNFQDPVEPTDAMTFSLYGLTSFDVQGWNGSSWVTLGSVAGNNLIKRTVSFSAFTTNRIRIIVKGIADGTYARITEIEAWTASTAQTTANYALAVNGGVATASSTLRVANAVGYVNDGQRSGAGWSTGGGGWADATRGTFPDWVQIAFNGLKTIDHVVVYSVQDNFQSPVEPTDTMTFTLYGLVSFDVQGWNGSGWSTLASVRGNNLVKRTVSIAPYTTDRVRVVINGVGDGAWSRVTEIEAWGQ